MTEEDGATLQTGQEVPFWKRIGSILIVSGMVVWFLWWWNHHALSVGRFLGIIDPVTLALALFMISFLMRTSLGFSKK
jgi:hypothetical protein